jgi:membrane associated rhomboid family serine protease
MVTVFALVGCAVGWAAARQEGQERFAVIPTGQDTGPADPDHHKRFPLVTLCFIAASVLLCLTLPETAAHTLLHGTYDRLFVDTIFLGLLGCYLEPRLGALRTLTLFFMGSFVAGLIGLNFLLPQVAVPGGGLGLLRYPPAGGTGAVAALLGVGSLGWNPGRDAGKTLVEKGPRCCGIMDILWPLLTTLVFWGPFSGHTMPITGPGGMAGYGGQVGGFLSGLAMALILRTMGENDIDRGTPSAASCALVPVVAARPDKRAAPFGKLRDRLALAPMD